MNFKNWIILLISIFVSSISFAALTPDELVKKTANDVIAEIKNNPDLKDGNREKIYKLAQEKILPNFDFTRICRLVLGKHYRRMNDEQKSKFKIEFKRLLLRTYAIALLKYSDQKIKVKPLKMKDSSKVVIVKTEITQDGSQPIDVNYALSKNTGSWLVFDIIIEGVSLITNYRSQFGSEIKQNGIEKLLQKLSLKNNATN